MSDVATSGQQKTPIMQIAIASWIGTSIEWYDFFLFGTASALVFNRIFFPGIDPLAGLLAAYAVFWVGFLGRPIGGVIFGHYGDRLGRKGMLIVTLITMGVATFLIGCLPDYNVLGVAAPILLVLLRLLQGIAVGGEWGGAVLMATEHAHKNRRGFYGSWPQMGVPIGVLLSSLAFSWASTTFPQEQFLSIGWRIPFLLSVILIAVGLFIRLRITETPEFERIRENRTIVKMPILEVLRKDYKNVLLASGIFFATNASFYIFITFIVSYGQNILQMPRGIFLDAVLISSVVLLIVLPVGGALSDRLGRGPIVLGGAIFLAITAFPTFWLLDSRSTPLIFLALALAEIGIGLMYGPLAAYFTELFGANVRYSGASLGYQAASIFAGGLAPFIATWLLSLSGNASWPVAFYLMVVAAITIVSTILAMRYRATSASEQPVTESVAGT